MMLPVQLSPLNSHRDRQQHLWQTHPEMERKAVCAMICRVGAHLPLVCSRPDGLQHLLQQPHLLLRNYLPRPVRDLQDDWLWTPCISPVIGTRAIAVVTAPCSNLGCWHMHAWVLDGGIAWAGFAALHTQVKSSQAVTPGIRSPAHGLLLCHALGQ